MILYWLVLILLLGGVLAWFVGRWSISGARWISLLTFSVHLVLVVAIWLQYLGDGQVQPGSWFLEFDTPWIPSLGIHFHFAMDGFSLLLVLLADFLGIIAVLASWRSIEQRAGFFHFNLLWIVTGLVGTFTAMDLFLFYFFWEMMLVPLYLLIGIWGHERRIYASIKFFIFTQASGLLMLLAILGLYWLHGKSTGEYTFDYMKLIGTALNPTTAFWLMMGFFVAFAVKLPAVPVHTWLPDAHTEAPTAGSVVLAGLVLKAGAYGMLRFVVPLFPGAAFGFRTVAMILGLIGILYGAWLAYGQNDLKRLVAYTSISHMGFVLIGIFAWNQLALQGAVIIMLAHGIGTGALFVMSGDIGDRLGTRDMRRMGGLWTTMPRMGGIGMFFAMAALGLPGLGNFVGEILVLLGAYRVNIPIAALATIGFVVATVYSLAMIQRTFFGPNEHDWKLPDATPREVGIMVAMMLAMLWLGFYPQTFLNTASGALETMQQYAGRQQALIRETALHVTDHLSDGGRQ